MCLQFMKVARRKWMSTLWLWKMETLIKISGWKCPAYILDDVAVSVFTSGLLWNERMISARVCMCLRAGVTSVVRTWCATAAAVGVRALAKGTGLGRPLPRSQNHLPVGQTSCQWTVVVRPQPTKPSWPFLPLTILSHSWAYRILFSILLRYIVLSLDLI